MDGRRAELSVALAAVQRRVAAGCAAAGRDQSDVTLIVVTKTYPASDVRLLAGLGVREVGESRDQEAAPKAGQALDLGLRWHFIGRLQTNKARSVAQYADQVHSVDRESLVGALDRGAQAHGRQLGCFVQVSLDGDPARGGVPAAEVARLADQVVAASWLRLSGVMAVAPMGADLDASFGALRRISDELRTAHPEARHISAGMSGDLEEALRHGATHLRVGSAVLGHRPALG
jgi:PLP dependent protein